MTHAGYRVRDLRVPAHWTALRLKDITTYVNRGIAPTYSEDPTSCIAFSQKCVRQDRSVDPSLGRFALPPDNVETLGARLTGGEVVVNSTGVGTLGRAGLTSERDESEPRLVADGHVPVIRTDPRQCHSKYLWYALATDVFYRFANDALAVGSTNQTELGREAIRRVALALPPLEEQRRLVEHLDRECSAIAAVLEALGATNPTRGSLAGLLEEHRQALITAAVTGALDAQDQVA